MSATNASLQTMADAGAALGASISLHTADPGTTGASEVSGGSPAYSRKTTTFGASTIVAGNAVATGSTVTFDVPASTTVAFYGVWSGATFKYGRPVTPNITIGSGGNGKVDIIPTFTYQQA